MPHPFPHSASHDRRIDASASDYPVRVRDLARANPRPGPRGVRRDAPTLWVRGRGPWPPGPTLAIVGSRAATPEALRSAGLVARRAAAAGVWVASGLARGVDGAAHAAALEAGGRSIAVLGTGVDRIYPGEHAALYTALVASGALVSPHQPGSPPLPGHFPARNRVLAAMASDVVLIQAERNSGTASTLATALALGRRVWVMAGPLGDESFRGNAMWLARARTDARIALLLDPAEPAQSALESDDATPRGVVSRLLATTPRTLEALARAAGVSAPEAAVALVELELLGVAERLPGHRYRRRIG